MTVTSFPQFMPLPLKLPTSVVASVTDTIEVNERQNRQRHVLIVRSVTLLAVCSVALLVIALFPAYRAARKAALRMSRANELRMVFLGLRHFDEVYKRLPPAVRRDDAGRELCSWRFQILPYLESMMIGIDFSDRWDDPANRFLSTMPYDLFCWSHSPFPESLHTSVVAVTGRGTAFDGGRSIGLSDVDPETIIVVEMANSQTHWMEPGDLHIENVPDSIVRGLDGTGFFVVFADGAVWFLSSDVPLADLKKFFTSAGAQRHDRDQLLEPFASRLYPSERE